MEQPVLDFFPERSVANWNANKEAMTLEDLLTMRSGAKRWWESDNVFVVHREEIGDRHPREEQASATFAKDRVKLEIRDSSGVLTLTGRLEK